MPLQDYMDLVSTDDHLIEHATVWTDRLPAKYQEMGPHIVETTQDVVGHHGNTTKAGAQAWSYEGRIYPQIGLNAVAGRKIEEIGMEPLRYTDMIPGCYDPLERVKDMDRDGIAANLCFPSFPRFAGTVFAEGKDKDLALLCSQAWNDFVLDEWCAAAPERFIPMVMLPFWDVAASVAEIHRTVAKGARAITFPENPVPLGLPSFHTDHWDPLFDAAEEADIPLSMHFGTSGKPPKTADDAPMAVMVTLMACNSMSTMIDLMFSPVFTRHPKLRVALAEGGIGWMPWALERADAVWHRHRHYQNLPQDMPPSERFAKHFWGCFIDDEHGIRSRHEIGVDRITWECDYPHSDSLWPGSRERATEVFANVPDDEVHRMVELNARELFNFPRVEAPAAGLVSK